MDSLGLLSLAPPFVAIILAVLTSQVYLSLFVGIWIGHTLIIGGDPFTGFVVCVHKILSEFQDPGNVKVILFCAFVGSLLALMQRSGGVDGFVKWIDKRNFGKGERSAGLLAFFIGTFVFIETSISSLITGTVCRPIFDKRKISREKLAYICDSTSAPICILIPLNAWGAFILGILAKQGIENPFGVFVNSIAYNFYAIISIGLLLFVIISGKDFGPMKKAQLRAKKGQLFRKGANPMVSEEVTLMKAKGKGLARNLVIPVLILISAMPVGLYLTGNGDIQQGSGSTSVFWAVIVAILGSVALYRVQSIFKFKEMGEVIHKGFLGLIPLALLMLLAFSLGSVCKEMGTGFYVAEVTKSWLSPKMVPLFLFLGSCLIAFSTGTSWGTFATMIPIGIPMALAYGVNPSLVVGAVLGGGIFGDHCSPISDTTIVSSMAAACDHIDHVRTQLVYAVTAASIAILAYLIFAITL